MTKNTNDKNKFLRFLYGTIPGRVLLRPLCGRKLSHILGKFLDTGLSRPLIKVFIKSNHIDITECEKNRFQSFNDFFTRSLKPNARPLPKEKNILFSPCDGLLSAYHITNDLVLPIKQSCYKISDLLGNSPIKNDLENGICLVFRLCVDHYHRYCYIDDGIKGDNIFIPGKLHTIRPIALEKTPVFIQNCKEYTIMETENFGTVVQVEVGAMLVGKICNLHNAGIISRGKEKGMFLYGGSTIILLLEECNVSINDSLFTATRKGLETPVKMGQPIGRSLLKP